MDSLEKHQIVEQFNDWIRHPYTERLISHLEKMIEKHHTQAEAYVGTFKVPEKETLLFYIHSAAAIRDTVSLLKKPLVDFIIKPTQ